MTYLNIEMNEYQYIPREIIPINLEGFFTSNVCECVTGFISSDRGIAFFHFFRRNDENQLINLIKRDFQDANSLKITLVGANIGKSILFPSKVEGKSLKRRREDVEDEQSLIEELKREVVSGSPYFTHFQMNEADRNKFSDCSRDQPQFITDSLENKCTNLITYNFSMIEKTLKKNPLEVNGFDDSFTFKANSLKDFIAYQNLSRIVYALISLDLFNADNTSHYNTPIGNNLFVSLDGHITSNRSRCYNLEKLEERSAEVIPDCTHYPTFHSMNKQNLIDSFKTKTE